VNTSGWLNVLHSGSTICRVSYRSVTLSEKIFLSSD